MVFDLVRVTGLEPVRHRHTPLKRACLPVPAHSQIWLEMTLLDYYSIEIWFVNRKKQAIRDNLVKKLTIVRSGESLYNEHILGKSLWMLSLQNLLENLFEAGYIIGMKWKRRRRNLEC
jgi:hypothetical protein